MIFNADGTVRVYNSGIPGGTQVYSMPPNGLMAVTGGDVVVEGTVKGRVTVTGDDDILINGDVRYADQSTGSWDTLALVAQSDIIIPTNYYTGTSSLPSFEPSWNGSRTVAASITGGVWGAANTSDVRIDATMVALSGSSPSVINPNNRLLRQLYIYGNSIGKIASATINSALTRGLNENYTHNTKLDILPPPGFQQLQPLTPTFMTFREVRTGLGG
jgi:hypothetical protein